MTSTPSHTILWISAHPEPTSLNGHLTRDATAHLEGQGHQVLRSDLYAMGWNPVLDRDAVLRPSTTFNPTTDVRQAYVDQRLAPDIEREQAKLRAADALVLQFPLWWYGMPAILKGWFDKVFHSGFAFGKDPATGRRLRFEQGPFSGKRALVAVTLGDRPQAIGPRGKSGELHEMMFGLLHGTLAYTGMDVLPPLAIPSADFIDEVTYHQARDRLFGRLDRLFTDDPIPYRPQFTGHYTEQWELTEDIRPGETGLSLHMLDASEQGKQPPDGFASPRAPRKPAPEPVALYRGENQGVIDGGAKVAGLGGSRGPGEVGAAAADRVALGHPLTPCGTALGESCRPMNAERACDG